IIFKSVKCSLMNGASQPSIDLHLRIRHHPLKHDVDGPSFPVCRDLEPMAVVTGFVKPVTRAIAVIISAEPLLLPTGRHRNGRPFPAIPPVRTIKFPDRTVISAGTR